MKTRTRKKTLSMRKTTRRRVWRKTESKNNRIKSKRKTKAIVSIVPSRGAFWRSPRLGQGCQLVPNRQPVGLGNIPPFSFHHSESILFRSPCVSETSSELAPFITASSPCEAKAHFEDMAHRGTIVSFLHGCSHFLILFCANARYTFFISST